MEHKKTSQKSTQCGESWLPRPLNVWASAPPRPLPAVQSQVNHPTSLGFSYLSHPTVRSFIRSFMHSFARPSVGARDTQHLFLSRLLSRCLAHNMCSVNIGQATNDQDRKSQPAGSSNREKKHTKSGKLKDSPPRRCQALKEEGDFRRPRKGGRSPQLAREECEQGTELEDGAS